MEEAVIVGKDRVAIGAAKARWLSDRIAIAVIFCA
jgi:hypothetical protein